VVITSSLQNSMGFVLDSPYLLLVVSLLFSAAFYPIPCQIQFSPLMCLNVSKITTSRRQQNLLLHFFA